MDTKPSNNELLRSLFLQDNTPQCLLLDLELVCCNDLASKLLLPENSVLNAPIPVLDICPDFQPDGSLSQTKAEKMLAICDKVGKHRFSWVYQSLSGHLEWLQLTLTKKPFSGRNYIHVSAQRMESAEQPLASNDSQVYQSSDSQVNFNHYVLLNEYKRAIDQSSIVSKADSNGIITYVNDKFMQVSGYSKEELIGKPHSIISHPDTPKTVFKELWSTIRSGKVWKGIIKNKKKNGEPYYVDSSISPIQAADGTISEFIAIRNDITEMYRQEKLIIYQNTDEDTGLPNRSKLLLDLNHTQRCHLAVVQFKELEQFAHVFSHQVNLQILALINDCISAHFKELATNIQLYKISNSKFAITCEPSVEEEGFQYQLEALLNYIMQTDFKVEGFEIPLTVQAGWSTGHHCQLNDALLAQKEAASQGVLSAKYEARNNTFKLDIENAIDWTVKLKSAIQEGKISLFGQSIYDNSGGVYSTEVLMRYFEPSLNAYISPATFLPYAKKSKIYHQLSKFIIAQSCQFFKDKKQRFSINFTLADLLDRDIREQVVYLLTEHELGPYLTLELVETEAFIDEDKVVSEFLTILKRLGVQIAIDDFGSGYSNFNYFTLLPVDIVKIDGSLIRDIDINEKHYLLVKSIAEFCHQMNIKVVAEFVENEVIFNKLNKLKIDYFQGYHLHKPEPLV